MSKEKNNLILLQEYLLPNFDEEIIEDEVIIEQEEGTPPPPFQMPGIIEALLLATSKPLTVDKINQCLHNPGKTSVLEALRPLSP